MSKEEILNKITEYYLRSRDFNGISLEDLYKSIALSENDFKSKILGLIRNRKIDLIYEGDIPNQHIKPFPAPTIEKQIEKLNQYKIDDHIKQSESNAEAFGDGEIKISFVQGIGCCVYPTPEHLKNKVDWKKYVSSDQRFKRVMDVGYLKGDYGKAKKAFGWEPKIRFQELVKLMVKEDMNRWQKWQKGERFAFDAPYYPGEQTIRTRALK